MSSRKATLRLGIVRDDVRLQVADDHARFSAVDPPFDGDAGRELEPQEHLAVDWKEVRVRVLGSHRPRDPEEPDLGSAEPVQELVGEIVVALEEVEVLDRRRRLRIEWAEVAELWNDAGGDEVLE